MMPAERSARCLTVAGKRRKWRLAIIIATLLFTHCALADEALDAEFLEFLAMEAKDAAQSRQDPELVAWLRDWWNPDSKTAVAVERTEEKP